ncbi:MAG: YihY/virulence factor BrkB family protein [Acidobacteriota bacterium]|nr:YihY/virulence factor BrkB family protein [Acidobacteriota bacterium]
MPRKSRHHRAIGQFLLQLGMRVWRESEQDNLFGLSAEMSFFFVLALFPFLIVIAALLGSLPYTNLWHGVLSWIVLYLPHRSQELVFETVADLTHGREGFLSLGLLSSAWATCGGVLSLIRSLNCAYEVQETRRVWRRLALSFVVVFLLAFLFLTCFAVLNGGKWAVVWLMNRMDHPVPTIRLLGVLRWAVSVPVMVAGLTVVDYLLPDVRRPWRWLRPGTLFAVAVWIPATFCFNVYVRSVGSYSRMYGTLAGFMILIVWIYLTSFITLLGAEINCELRKMRLEEGTTATFPIPIPESDSQP